MKKLLIISFVSLFNFILSDTIIANRYSSGKNNIIMNVEYLGRINKTYLGINIKNQNDTKHKGVEIKNVQKDSPAFNSGLKSGDIIISINRQLIEDSEQLINYLSKKKNGEILSFNILRKSIFTYNPSSIDVSLGSRDIIVFESYNKNKNNLYSIPTNVVINIEDDGNNLEPYNNKFYRGKEVNFISYYSSGLNNDVGFYSKSSNMGPILLSITGLSWMFINGSKGYDLDKLETLNDISSLTLFIGGLLLHSQLSKMENKIEQIDKSI